MDCVPAEIKLPNPTQSDDVLVIVIFGEQKFFTNENFGRINDLIGILIHLTLDSYFLAMLLTVFLSTL